MGRWLALRHIPRRRSSTDGFFFNAFVVQGDRVDSDRWHRLGPPRGIFPLPCPPPVADGSQRISTVWSAHPKPRRGAPPLALPRHPRATRLHSGPREPEPWGGHGPHCQGTRCLGRGQREARRHRGSVQHLPPPRYLAAVQPDRRRAAECDPGAPYR